MGTRFTAKNASQKIPEFGLDKRITNRTNEPFYECPVGKKAKFKGYAVCSVLGAATQANIESPSTLFNIIEWAASTQPWQYQVGTKVNFEIALAAGEQIRGSQYSGTNAEIEVIGIIEETPA